MMNIRSNETGPAQIPKKRRFSRISRACTECRIRKIRCDGRQPCQPCEDFDRHCTFSSTKAQRTGGAPRTKILEDRLRRARTLIAQLQAQNPSLTHQTELDAIFESPPGSPSTHTTSPRPADENQQTIDLENMMDGLGRLIETDNKMPEFYGGFSGFAFLQTTQRLFDDGGESQTDSPEPVPEEMAMSRLFDSPLPSKDSLKSTRPFTKLLPSRRTATRLLHVVFEQTYQLLYFLHEPSFQEHTNRIYDLDQEEFDDSDQDFLPLFLAVMAIGYLFDQKMHANHGCNRAIDQAMRNFITARQMIDPHRCRDLTTLQALLCFVLFLMSTARIATAHTFVSLAVASAMRMGLHSKTVTDQFSAQEIDSRRRVFWTIVKLDIYIATILGLPGLVNLQYVDQIRPSGNVMDYMTDNDTGPTTASIMFAASDHYLDFLLIVSKIVDKLYLKPQDLANKTEEGRTRFINASVIHEIESELKTWREKLPGAFNIAKSSQSPIFTSVTYELEMAHNVGHILLYRPFLHYLARTKDDNPPDNRQLRCAASCIKISRISIQRSEQMLRQGFIAPAAWQSVYTVFLSIVVLIFFLATQHGASDYDTVQEEAEIGIKILASTSCQDSGSKRCLDVLKVLARRLSRIVKLDVEQLERSATKLCHHESPISPFNQPDQRTPGTADVHKGKQSHHTGPGPVSLLESSDSSSQQAESSQQIPLRSAQAVQANATGGGAIAPQSGATTGMWPSNAGSSFAWSPSNFQAPTMSEDNPMEVPFIDTFAWPFSPDDGQVHGPHPPELINSQAFSPGSASMHLTAEDIAAFMRINPGEDPFQ